MMKTIKESVYFYYSSSLVASNLNKTQCRRQDFRNSWNERARAFQRRTSGGCFS